MNITQSEGWVSKVARSSVRFRPSGFVNRWMRRLPSLSLDLFVGTSSTLQSAPSAAGRLCASACTIVSWTFSTGTFTPCQRKTVRSKALLWMTILSAASMAFCSRPSRSSSEPSVRSHTSTGSSSTACAISITSACSA